MNRWVKIIGLSIVGLLIVLLAYFYLGSNKKVNGLYLIPDDAMYILETDDVIANWKELSDGSVWKFLKSHPVFKDVTEDADYLDQLIADNRLLFKLFGSREFILSAHGTRSGDYEFLFAVDLKRSAKIGVLYGALDKALKAGGNKVTYRDYGEFELMESMDSEKDVLTLCKISNFLVCSYSAAIVERSIDQMKEPVIARDIYFQDVYKRVNTDGLARFYINYNRIDELLGCYMSESNEMINDLSTLMRYSAFDLHSETDEWRIEGVSNLDDKVESYLLALLNSGKSNNKVDEVLSNRTAWFLSFNFSSIDKFYNELTSVLARDEARNNEFQKSQKKIENLLGISIKRQLIDWVSDEVTVAQMRSNGYTNRSDNLVVCMRTNDQAMAQQRLSEVAEQVKKRTPAKFKKIQYRNYEIQYLDIKGFFRSFFGKAFEKLEKPYYTAIGNYIIFSNNPLTLIGLIEDFENERTLSNHKAFSDFVENGNDESSLTLYISPRNSYSLVSKYADQDAQKTLGESKLYFEGFESFGFQLSAKNQMFQSFGKLRLKSSDTATDELLEEQIIMGKYKSYAIADVDTSNHFIVQLIEDGIFKRYYPDGESLEIRAETKKGIMHGKYEEFHLNGKIRVSGKYKNGRKRGLWKYFDLSGKQIKKKRH